MKTVVKNTKNSRKVNPAREATRKAFAGYGNKLKAHGSDDIIATASVDQFTIEFFDIYVADRAFESGFNIERAGIQAYICLGDRIVAKAFVRVSRHDSGYIERYCNVSLVEYVKKYDNSYSTIDADMDEVPQSLQNYLNELVAKLEVFIEENQERAATDEDREAAEKWVVRMFGNDRPIDKVVNDQIREQYMKRIGRKLLSFLVTLGYATT